MPNNLSIWYLENTLIVISKQVMNLNTLNIGLVAVYQTHLPKVKGFKSHPIYFYCCMKVLATLAGKDSNHLSEGSGLKSPSPLIPFAKNKEMYI